LLIDALAKVAYGTPEELPLRAPGRSLEVDDLPSRIDADEDRVDPGAQLRPAHTRRSSEHVAR
jgi:hypothetical protein